MSNTKTIPGFPEYMACTDGRIYSIKRERWLIPQNRGGGYHYVNLGRSNPRRVHRLVAITFLPNPYNKPQVNHIDGNKTNNSLTNLEWSTASENTAHAYSLGLMNIPKHEDRHNSKLSEKDIQFIREQYSNGIKQGLLAKQFSVDPSNISRIVNNKYWIGV